MLMLFFLFLLNLSPISHSNAKIIGTDIDNLPYRQIIEIPIDTSLEIAKYQPIDLKINFNNPCWAKDETHNSVRVGYDDGSGITEIESQIYDLEYSDDTHITSCGLVFLIPFESTGKEKYYVLYDSKETKPANYEDYLDLQDTHYFYEPISGQYINFDYYQIKQEGYVVYAIVQKGELLGNPVGQHVAKFKPKSTIVETYNIDQLGVFDMRYEIVPAPGYYGSSWATKVVKNVLVDGNLMIKVRIDCTSPNDEIRTDNIYTYYYCPTDTKKITVDTYHEVLKTVDVKKDSLLDGSYAGIVSIKSRSATIEKMNVGDILPVLSVYNKDETIREFTIPSNPESEDKEVVLSTNDDIDIGSKAWVCLNNPKIGKADGLIMESNKGIVEGALDGAQVKSYAKQNLKLPGLEADTGSVFLLKNTYEKGGVQDLTLQQGFIVNFNIQFVTTENEGVEKINTESEFFQKLVGLRPSLRENGRTFDEEEKEKFMLTANVHFAPSVPMGSLLSAALGKNISYIYAELYKEDDFKSSGSAGRLPLGSIELELEGKKLSEKIKILLGIFDWRNASFFKKIRFPGLTAGTYVVKIFKENPIVKKERQYIGFAIVDLEKNEKIHIYCRPQGTILLTVNDQKNQGVPNVKFLLQKDGITISDAVSDTNGSSVLYAPCFPLKPYELKTIYQGFLIDEKDVTFKLRNNIIKLKKSLSFTHYNFDLSIKDTWGFSPEVDLKPTLTSKEMIQPTFISAESKGNGKYRFENLYPANYNLKMSYKSFELEKEFNIKKDGTFYLVFPAEFKINFNTLNSVGDVLSEGKISISRQNKIVSQEIDDNGNAVFSLPPGNYQITVYSDEDIIAKQNLQISGDKKIDVLTNKESLIHVVAVYLGIALAAFSIIYLILKKNCYASIKIFVISLIFISLFSSWWFVTGENSNAKSVTDTMLIPQKIVTLTETADAIGGGVSQVPDEVTMVLGLLSILLAVACMLIFVTIFTKKKLRKVTQVFTILSIILLVLTLGVFYYAMGQLTEVSVGGFIGKGDIETTIPGVSENINLPSSWGPSTGFYLIIISLILLFIPFIYSVYKKIKKTSL